MFFNKEMFATSIPCLEPRQKFFFIEGLPNICCLRSENIKGYSKVHKENCVGGLKT